MKPWQHFTKKIADIFKVKTIVTLAIVFTFCFLTLTGREMNNEFMYIVFTVTAYYFATDNQSSNYKDSSDDG